MRWLPFLFLLACGGGEVAPENELVQCTGLGGAGRCEMDCVDSPSIDPTLPACTGRNAVGVDGMTEVTCDRIVPEDGPVGRRGCCVRSTAENEADTVTRFFECE